VSDNWVQFLPLVLLVILFWLLVLRPARARQRDFAGLQDQLTPGLRVMLASGIHGELVSVGDDTIELRIAPQTVITVARKAVGLIIEPASTDVSTEEST
jgi:preprotein translocase subunit YajC